MSVDELGFDACVDHRAPDFAGAARRPARTASTSTSRTSAARCWEAVLPLLNTFARVPVCGLIAKYNADRAAGGPGPHAA